MEFSFATERRLVTSLVRSSECIPRGLAGCLLVSEDDDDDGKEEISGRGFLLL